MARHLFWPATGRTMNWPVKGLGIDDDDFAAFADRFVNRG